MPVAAAKPSGPAPHEEQSYPDFVAYHFLNANGQLMAMEEDGANTEKFLKEGLNVDGSSILGMSLVEKSDLRLMPEEESYLTIQVGDDFCHHRFLSHLVDDQGKPHPRDPRGILQKQVDKAHAMGLEPYMFSEIEFYIVQESSSSATADASGDGDGTVRQEPADTAGYCSLPPLDKSYGFRQELGRLCKHLGMAVKRIHHEVGPGQNEIELNLTPSLKNADDTVLCMWIMEMLAARRGQKILFSPKPFADKAGNGLHHHILLRDLQTGENVLAATKETGSADGAETNDNNDDRLSDVCRHAIAGLLEHANDITAAFAASPETFARLAPGFEAPIFKTWGFSNRTALVRVPNSSVDSTRFEYRGGDLSGSVHLFGALLLAAALKGIQDKLEVPPCADFNVEALSVEELAARHIDPVPLTFEDCIQVVRSSEFLKESLGSEMVEFLIERDTALLSKGYNL